MIFSAPVTLAERAVEKDPENVFHVNTFGAVLYRAGRFDEALARLDEAESLQTKPDSKANSSPAYTWFFLAMTHYRLGNVDEARNWYDKAAAWTSEVLVSGGEDGSTKSTVTLEPTGNSQDATGRDRTAVGNCYGRDNAGTRSRTMSGRERSGLRAASKQS